MASHRAVPQPFTGRISPADAARGARVTQADALRLIEDAKLLLQAARFPTAAMVAVMALDEMSRVFQVLTLSTIDGSEQLVAAWKEFRGDRRTFPWSMIQPVEGEDSARPMGDPELAGMLSFIRKLGSRADFIQPGLWVDPAELVSAELAASIVASVESICVAIEPDSLELWSEALRSLPRNATAGMALARYRAMLETAGFAQSAANTGDRRRNSGGAVRRARPLDAFAAARRR